MKYLLALSFVLSACAQSLGYIDGSTTDADVIIVTDACSIQHPQCARDQDCDDGNFCNGIEQCSAGCCRPGTPPICNSLQPCITATCDTMQNQCVYTRHHDQCGAGERCTSSQGCAPPSAISCLEGGTTTCTQTLGDVDCMSFTCSASTMRCESMCN